MRLEESREKEEKPKAEPPLFALPSLEELGKALRLFEPSGNTKLARQTVSASKPGSDQGAEAAVGKESGAVLLNALKDTPSVVRKSTGEIKMHPPYGEISDAGTYGEGKNASEKSAGGASAQKPQGETTPSSVTKVGKPGDSMIPVVRGKVGSTEDNSPGALSGVEVYTPKLGPERSWEAQVKEAANRLKQMVLDKGPAKDPEQEKMADIAKSWVLALGVPEQHMYSNYFHEQLQALSPKERKHFADVMNTLLEPKWRFDVNQRDWLVASPGAEMAVENRVVPARGFSLDSRAIVIQPEWKNEFAVAPLGRTTDWGSRFEENRNKLFQELVRAGQEPDSREVNKPRLQAAKRLPADHIIVAAGDAADSLKGNSKEAELASKIEQCLILTMDQPNAKSLFQEELCRCLKEVAREGRRGTRLGDEFRQRVEDRLNEFNHKHGYHAILLEDGELQVKKVADRAIQGNPEQVNAPPKAGDWCLAVDPYASQVSVKFALSPTSAKKSEEERAKDVLDNERPWLGYVGKIAEPWDGKFVRARLTDKEWNRLSKLSASADRSLVEGIRGEINRYGKSETELLTDLMKSHRSIGLGMELVHERAEERYATWFKALKNGGATHLAIDLKAEQLAKLDRFFETGDLSEIKKDRQLIWHTGAIPAIKAARSVGLQLVPIGTNKDEAIDSLQKIDLILRANESNKVVWAVFPSWFERDFDFNKHLQKQEKDRGGVPTIFIDTGTFRETPISEFARGLKEPVIVPTESASRIGKVEAVFDRTINNWDYYLVNPARSK